MAIARIEVNAVQIDAVSVPVGVPVLLSNDDDGDETTYAWTIVDQPEGAADLLDNTTIESPQFTPLKEGTYQLRLVVDAALGTESIDTCAISVLRELDGERVPAATETIETSSVKGWGLALNRILNRSLDLFASGGPVIAVQTPGGFGPGEIVLVLGAVDTPSGAHEVPVIYPPYGSETNASGLMGVLIDGVVAGSLSAGDVALVRIFGIVPFPESGSPGLGDPVYVSDTGLPSLTPGTFPRVVGRVAASSGGTWRWMIDGRDALASARRPTTHPLEMFDTSGADWANTGLTGAGPCGKVTNSATAGALIVPLKVAPGETLVSVRLDINQGSTSARMNATLIRGDATANSSSAPVLSPATSGAVAWEPFAGIAVPTQCVAGEKLWVAITGSGGGGTARTVTLATALVAPPMT